MKKKLNVFVNNMFLPKQYKIPKLTEDEKHNNLVAQARSGKKWAIYKLEQLGEGDNMPWEASVCGEPPVEYSKL